MEKILKVVHGNRDRIQSSPSQQREIDDSWRRKTSKGGTSKEPREDIAHLVEDVLELRHELEQLREVRWGPQAEVADSALQAQLTELREAIREIVHTQEAKFDHYDLEIRKCSAGVSGMQQKMDSSTPQSAAQQEYVMLVQQTSAEIQKVKQQQEELSNSLASLKFDHYDLEISTCSEGASGLQQRMDSYTPQSAAQQEYVMLVQQTSAEIQKVKQQQEELRNSLASLRTAGSTDQQNHSTHNGTTGMSGHTAVADIIPLVTITSNDKLEHSPELQVNDTQDPQRMVMFLGVQESTWDATVFMGSGILGHFSFLECCMMILLTAICQFAMAVIVIVNMTDNDFDTKGRQHLQDWRLQVANKIEYMQPWTQQTLGSRVCDPSAHVGLELSYQQALIVRNLSAYLAIGSNSGIIEWGPVMVILALLSWYLVVVKELESGMRFLLAFAALPRGPTRFEWDADGLNLKSVSMVRLVFLAVVVFFRFAIALCLAYSGTSWLIATKGIENLMLNHVALEVVLQMDERIFSTVAPFKAKHLANMLQPWPLPRWQKTITNRISVAVLIGLMSGAIITGLVPEIRNRRHAFDILCKGNKDFVTAVDGAGFLYWVSTPPIEALQPLYDEAVDLIVIGSEEAPKFQLPAVHGQVYSLQETIRQDSAERATRWNPSCEDLFGTMSTTSYSYGFLLALFQKILEDDAFQVCEDLSTDVCHEETDRGVKVRMFCSRRCGCRSLVSPYPLAAPSQGCPASCQGVYRFEFNPEPANCTSTELPTSETYQTFAKSLILATSQFRGGGGAAWWGTFAKNFSIMGCQALNAFYDHWYVGRTGWEYNFNLCTGVGVSNPLRAFSALCPETCACIANSRECAPRCPQVDTEDTD